MFPNQSSVLVGDFITKIEVYANVLLHNPTGMDLTASLALGNKTGALFLSSASHAQPNKDGTSLVNPA